MAPSSLRGAEGRWRCRRLLVAFSGSLHQTLSLCPCAATVQRAPSHNRWGVSETTLPAKTQGRTLDCPFNFPPPRVAGWLLMCRCQVCNKAAVALVATGPRRGALEGHVESGLSVVVEWRYHSERAGTPRRATNPKTGGHRPKKRLLRQVHPPDARCPMADQPRRYWCTYQQHCGNAGPGVTGARTSGIAGMPGPHESGQPPAGDRPNERRAPSLGLEGTNPRTGRPYFLTRSGPTTCPNCLRFVCPSSYGEFYSGLGALHSCTYLRTPGFLLLFSFVSASSFCVLETFLLGRLTATREVVQLPQELLSNTALGRYFRFATSWRAFRALGTGVRRESSKASGLPPESCFLPLVYHPLFPEVPDGRLPLVRGSFF